MICGVLMSEFLQVREAGKLGNLIVQVKSGKQRNNIKSGQRSAENLVILCHDPNENPQQV